MPPKKIFANTTESSQEEANSSNNRSNRTRRVPTRLNNEDIQLIQSPVKKNMIEHVKRKLANSVKEKPAKKVAYRPRQTTPITSTPKVPSRVQQPNDIEITDVAENQQSKTTPSYPKSARSGQSAPSSQTIYQLEEVKTFSAQRLPIAQQPIPTHLPSNYPVAQGQQQQPSHLSAQAQIYGTEAESYVKHFISRIDFLDADFQKQTAKDLVRELWAQPSSPKLTYMINQVIDDYNIMPPVEKVVPIVFFDSASKPVINFVFLSPKMSLGLDELFNIDTERKMLGKTLYSLVYGRYQKVQENNSRALVLVGSTPTL